MIPVEWHLKFIEWQSRQAARWIEANVHSLRSVIEVGVGLGGIARHLPRHLIVRLTDKTPQAPDVFKLDVMGEFFSDFRYDLLISSNMLEHVPDPRRALSNFRAQASQLWLSWTPWWSPFGGHDVAPWHYLGRKTQLDGLYKTTVRDVVSMLGETGWDVKDIRPRYWPRLPWLARWPITREWATWNVQIHAA